MKIYTLEEIQRLAREVAAVDPRLTDEDAFEGLTQMMRQDDAQLEVQTGNTTTDRVLNAVYGLALGKLQNVTHRRPQVLECDVWRFQNKKEKWVAFVGLLDGRPYEIFTGLQDDDEGIVLPKSVHTGWIIKNFNPDGTTRYDFSFQNRRAYKTTVEGLSEKFNKEYWNYAKLISGVLRYRMPVESVIQLIESLQLESDTINTWKAGVVRALKKYTAGGVDIETEDATPEEV